MPEGRWEITVQVKKPQMQLVEEKLIIDSYSLEKAKADAMARVQTKHKVDKNFVSVANVITKQEPTYTVAFEKNGGLSEANPNRKPVPPGKTVGALPAPPIRPGFTFDGWFTAASGGTAFTASTPVNANMPVYARWKQNPATPAAPAKDTDVRGALEGALEKLSVSTEFSGLIAEINNLEKMVSKLGGIGKVLTGIDIANDLIKYYETAYKLATTTDKNKRKDLMWELALIAGKLTKTAVTIAFPPAGIVDAGISVVTMVYTQVQKVAEEKSKAKARESKEFFDTLKANYGKEQNALKQDEQGYWYELNLYASGLSMALILEQRRNLKAKLTSMFVADKKIPNPYRK